MDFRLVLLTLLLASKRRPWNINNNIFSIFHSNDGHFCIFTERTNDLFAFNSCVLYCFLIVAFRLIAFNTILCHSQCACSLLCSVSTFNLRALSCVQFRQHLMNVFLPISFHQKIKKLIESKEIFEQKGCSSNVGEIDKLSTFYMWNTPRDG